MTLFLFVTLCLSGNFYIYFVSLNYECPKQSPEKSHEHTHVTHDTCFCHSSQGEAEESLSKIIDKAAHRVSCMGGERREGLNPCEGMASSLNPGQPSILFPGPLFSSGVNNYNSNHKSS